MIEYTLCPCAASNLVRCLATFPEPPKTSVVDAMLLELYVRAESLQHWEGVKFNAGA